MCKIEGCKNLSWAKSLCGTHYRRLQRHGDPNYINPKCNRDGKAKQRKYAKVKQWKKNNWDEYKHYLSARKSRLKIATPQWANLKAIEQIYKNCPKNNHVDHIIPLNGKNVCGLHVENNLQYLDKIQNLSKSNKFTK
jgi:hypothetical protein